MELKFRKLKANEIDVRIGTQKLENKNDKASRVLGASYLLYKDARVDMTLLDETVGSFNWQREHEFKDGKLYCKVSLYDEEKKQWVSKEDVGTESNEEAEKGQASDSFKRACFNWGIGRELYTAPFIWISPIQDEDLRKTKMYVKEISYTDNEITTLVIVDATGRVRFTLGSTPTQNVQNPQLIKQLKALGGSLEIILPYTKKSRVEDITNDEISSFIKRKQAQLEKQNAPKDAGAGLETIFGLK